MGTLSPRDDQLDAAFLAIMNESPDEPPTDPKSVLEKAQQLAAKLNIFSCRFESEGEIMAALGKLPNNSKAILKIALGMGGEIAWVTGIEPWNEKEQMKRRLGHNVMAIPADIDSYRSTTVSARQFRRNTTPDWLEYEIGELTNQTPDLASPLVLHISIRGITFRDESFIREMRDLLIHQLTKVMPLIEGVTAPFEVELVNGRDLNFSVPIRDYPQPQKDDDEEDADHYLSGIVTFLESRAKGDRGSRRFTTSAYLTAPEPDVFNRRAESALLYRHHCDLFSQQNPPNIQEIASFFEITSDQVTNVIRGFLSNLTLASSPITR